MRYDKENRKVKVALERCEKAEQSLVSVRQELDSVRFALDSTMHEARRFSGQIARQCEELNKEARKHGESALAELSDTIFYTSGMLSARLAFTDLELNPSAIAKQATFRSGIYKKFDKAKHVLSSYARDKRVRIVLRGSSQTEIEASQAIDLLPFVILDNAIKYSPAGQDVIVEFFDPPAKKGGYLEVRSIGPRMKPNEVDRIFEPSFRGSNVMSLPAHGEGLGLYLAKRICDFHGLSLIAEPSNIEQFNLNGLSYAEFKLVVSWR